MTKANAQRNVATLLGKDETMHQPSEPSTDHISQDRPPTYVTTWTSTLTGPLWAAGIRTKYLGPTDTLGSRIVATWTDKPNGPVQRVTLTYDDALSGHRNHDRAACALMDKYLDWLEYVGGPAPGRYVKLQSASTPTGYVYTAAYA
jgi:hypothetical protein